MNELEVGRERLRRDREREPELRHGRFRRGDEVELVGNYPSDPYIMQFRRYARIAQLRQGDEGVVYMVTLDATLPPDQQFGPFPASRFKPVRPVSQ